MKKLAKILAMVLVAVSLLGVAVLPMKVRAEGDESVQYEVVNAGESGIRLSTTGVKALAAAIAIGLAAALGALGMGIATSKAVEGISRQPEASGKIQSLWMLGMVFIETVAIYALVVTILIIFVLV